MMPAFITPSDAARLEKNGFRISDIADERIVGGKRILVLKKVKGACIFWNRETQACSVYKDRPYDCFLFPFDILLLEGRYRWIMYTCDGDRTWCNPDRMLDIIEKTEQFKELSKYVHEYSLYFDKAIMQKFGYKILREVRIPRISPTSVRDDQDHPLAEVANGSSYPASLQGS